MQEDVFLLFFSISMPKIILHDPALQEDRSQSGGVVWGGGGTPIEGRKEK